MTHPPITPVPATLPGVVRRGTPCTLTDHLDVPIGLRGLRCVVVSVTGSDARIVVDGHSMVRGADLRWLTVDMTDDTGLDRVAQAVGLDRPAWLARDGDGVHLTDHAGQRFDVPDGDALWALAVDEEPPNAQPPRKVWGWPVAEALARVAVHVLGGAR